MIRGKKGFVEILFFFVICLFSAAAGRVTPSLPQRGRQHTGSIPLPPLLSGFFINLLMIIAISGDDESGGGGSMMCEEPPRATSCFSPGVQQSPAYLFFFVISLFLCG